MRGNCFKALTILATAAVPAAATAAVGQDWRLKVVRDAFASQTYCGLATRDGLVRYLPGAIGFRFPHRRDTLSAIYRIDGGPPVVWQDRYPILVASDVHVDGSTLDDPTAGIVWIPQAELVSAHRVSIRLTTKDRPQEFAFPPIAPLLANAAARGCRFLDSGRR